MSVRTTKQNREYMQVYRKLHRAKINERTKLAMRKHRASQPKKVKRTAQEKKDRKREMELLYWHKNKLAICENMKAKRAIFRLANPLPPKVEKVVVLRVKKEKAPRIRQTKPKMTIQRTISPQIKPALDRLAMIRELAER